MAYVRGDRATIQHLHLRFVWLAELDLMAEMVGFELEERWSDWDRSAYGPGCRQAFSIYRRLV